MTENIDHKKRIRSLKDRIKKLGLDCLLVTNRTNVSYLSGFRASDALVLVTGNKSYFITDSRYAEDAERSLRGFKIEIIEHSTYETIKNIIKRSGLKRIGFESMDIPYDIGCRLKSSLRPAEFKPVKDVVENIRTIKDISEQILIRKSVALVKRVFKHALSRVRPGVSEKFLSGLIETDFIKNGAAAGFDSIVASGANSSKPHAFVSDEKIKNNSFVMMDIGCRLNGYCSDITRMVVVGKVPGRFKKIYMIVKKAQELAIEKIRPGVKASEVDSAARDYITNKGFGKNFGHSLGHGVGMDVHEKPSISGVNDTILKKGMVFTIEPAIYLPGFGGVRIEDMVLVTDNGCEILTR